MVVHSVACEGHRSLPRRGDYRPSVVDGFVWSGAALRDAPRDRERKPLVSLARWQRPPFVSGGASGAGDASCRLLPLELRQSHSEHINLLLNSSRIHRMDGRSGIDKP